MAEYMGIWTYLDLREVEDLLYQFEDNYPDVIKDWSVSPSEYYAGQVKAEVEMYDSNDTRDLGYELADLLEGHFNPH